MELGEFWARTGEAQATLLARTSGANGFATWHHYAFSYDQATGVGAFYVDGVVVASNDGIDGRALFWGGASPLRVGQLMDYASAFNGTLDELRLSDVALPATQFLGAVPEPGAALLLALAFLAARSRQST